MPRWSLLSGAPRFGEAPSASGTGKGSVAALTRHARRLALAGGTLTVLAAAELSRAWLMLGEDPAATGTTTALGLAAVALGWLVAWGAASRRALDPLAPAGARPAFALLSLALATLVAALTLPEAALALAARALPGPALGTEGVGVAIALVVVAPVVTGLLVHATGLAAGVAGPGPRRVPAHRAWAARSADDLATPRTSPLAALTAAPRHWLLGLALPGLLLADTVGTRVRAFAVRFAGRAVDRVHADVDADALADALRARGLTVDADGAGLVVALPAEDPTEVVIGDRGRGLPRAVAELKARLAARDRDGAVERVRVRVARVHLPPVDADRVLDISGPPHAVVRVRRLLETDLVFLATFTWSREARRVEARLNALAREAGEAGTMEERALLLEEAQEIAARTHRRGFLEEETALLSAWKATRLHVRLQDAMLNAPPARKAGDRVVAPAPALPPDVGRVVAAGGLAAVRAVTYVPHLVVPVRTAWGEQEVLVNALTGRADLRDGRALLAHARLAGAVAFVERTGATRFVDAPPAGRVVHGAVRRALRHDLRYWGPFQVDEALVETVYVPFVEADGHVVNAVTGRETPELAKALPAAKAAA